jgi:signal peptidase I
MAGRRRRPKQPRSGFAGLVELVVTVAIAVAVAFLVQAFLVKPYRIPSASMFPTLHIGQRILINRLDTAPKLGDVAVFHPPAGATSDASPVTGYGACGDVDQGFGRSAPCDTPTGGRSRETFVKRVVGLPGNTLRIIAGHVYRDGVEERGAYVQPCTGGAGQCTFSETIRVPVGDYYMMGDNRGNSDDSRFWGPVPRKWIIGVAFLTYWPPDRIGTL